MKCSLTRVCTAMVLAAPVLFAASGAAYAESKLPQPDPAGSILDGRLSEVSDNGAYFAERPYTEGASHAVGQIYSPSSICSGSVINTSKKNLVITAGHCVGSQKDGKYSEVSDKIRDVVLKKQMEFLPSFDGTKNGGDPARYPLGKWFVKNIYLLPESANSHVDVALLELYPNEEGKDIQDVIGGYDIHAPITATDRIQASLVGYPGPAPFNASLQAVCVGDYTYHSGKGNAEISRVNDQKECWVGGGSSGGPYLTQGKTPDSPKQVLTVLNSNGGGNVPVVIDELLKQAGATRD